MKFSEVVAKFRKAITPGDKIALATELNVAGVKDSIWPIPSYYTHPAVTLNAEDHVDEVLVLKAVEEGYQVELPLNQGMPVVWRDRTGYHAAVSRVRRCAAHHVSPEWSEAWAAFVHFAGRLNDMDKQEEQERQP